MHPEKSSAILSDQRYPVTALESVIENYVFRSIDQPSGSYIHKYMPCRLAQSIDFFIGDQYDTYDLATNELMQFYRCTIRGPRTYTKNAISISGKFKSFSIRFKPTGIYQLFKIPMEAFCDKSVDASLVYPNVFDEMTIRLMKCKDIQSCIDVVEPYFINLLTKQSSLNPVASKLAELIKSADNNVPLSLLYAQLPLTPRQLERNFLKEVGISPKLYYSLVRFENLVRASLTQPDIRWVELAYKHRYYDQTHMIKDFKRFLKVSPKQFNKDHFAFYFESLISLKPPKNIPLKTPAVKDNFRFV